MNDEHRWSSSNKRNLGGYKGWCVCNYCGAERFYDSMPGWPGWYVYFTKGGGYGPDEGRQPPACSGDPQLTLPGIL